MINHIYQLISPKVFSVKYADIGGEGKIIVRPSYLAVCHADQRYYLGQRDHKVLAKKLPMALTHEARTCWRCSAASLSAPEGG